VEVAGLEPARKTETSRLKAAPKARCTTFKYILVRGRKAGMSRYTFHFGIAQTPAKSSLCTCQSFTGPTGSNNYTQKSSERARRLNMYQLLYAFCLAALLLTMVLCIQMAISPHATLVRKVSNTTRKQVKAVDVHKDDAKDGSVLRAKLASPFDSRQARVPS
jgi:hypothetical protein